MADESTTSTQRIDGYARGLLEVARAEGDVEGITDQIFRVAKAVESSEPLRDALTNPRIPVDRKQGIIDELLGARSQAVTVGLVNFVVSAGRGKDLGAVAERLASLAAEAEQQVVAEVRSAVELDEATVRRLEAKLGEATGKQIQAKVAVDPEVLGGLVAKVGDRVFDGSVKSRFLKLREAWG